VRLTGGILPQSSLRKKKLLKHGTGGLTVQPINERRAKLLECRRELDKGMLATGSVDYLFWLDVPKLLWWLCKAVLLLIEKELKK
jgi:hypothetical protein